MSRALPVIEKVFKQYAPQGFQVRYTAGREHGHSFASFHHSGSAVDIKTNSLPDNGLGTVSSHIATALQGALNTQLGSGKYWVIRNDAGPKAPHIHVQYQKGQQKSDPVDFRNFSAKTKYVARVSLSSQRPRASTIELPSGGYLEGCAAASFEAAGGDLGALGLLPLSPSLALKS